MSGYRSWFRTAAAGCGTAPALTSGTRTIQSGGKSRGFIRKVPDGYDNTHPYRLAFEFHWWGGTANDVASGGSDGAARACHGMLSQANNSTIFVAPQGIGNGWADPGGEDVTVTDDMVRVIGNALCVDTSHSAATRSPRRSRSPGCRTGWWPRTVARRSTSTARPRRAVRR